MGEGANGDVYVDHGGSIAAYTSSGERIQEFGSGQLQGGAGIAVDSRQGDVYVVDEAEDKIDVFEPEAVAKPTVEGLAAEYVSSGEAELTAKLDPEGAATHYYFEYGTTDCSSSPSCVDVPEAPGAEVPAGYGEQRVSVRLAGLRADTTYYFRILARHAAEEEPATGEEELGTLTTLPASQGVLADGRAWELVSPAEKDGSGIEPLAKEGGVIQASVDGDAITYVANGPVGKEPQGNRAPEATQVLSVRSPSGWVSEELVTPHEKGEGLEVGEPSEYRFFSEDLALGVLQPPGGKVDGSEAPPLAPGASEKTIYLRDNPLLAPEAEEQTAYAEAEANRGTLAPGYLPLLTPLTETAKTKFGGHLEFLDATADGSHVIFESGEVALLSGSASGLYEWQAGGGLQLVSVLPNGQPAGDPQLGDAPRLGDEDANVRNAVSGDGSRVVFYSQGLEEGSETSEYHRLYMRDTTTGDTIQLNAAQGVTEPAGEEEASEVAFQGASSDGSRVFFTDTAPLTVESAQRPPLGGAKTPADLYEFQLTSKPGEALAGKLTDLTPDPEVGSAGVLNVLPGISEDGAYAYFVANGALTSGAQPGDCAHEIEETVPPDAACNLYLWHEGTLTLIARLSDEDSGDWGSLEAPVGSKGFVQPRPDLADLTARVSPNGRYLAFMSKMPLTEYDNLDANHQDEGIRDQEVYLYDAATRLLTCVSCNARGPSVGVYDTQRTGEGQGLLVDRREDWKSQYLAGSLPGWDPLGIASGAIHQPRYLSNEGRLFFNSPDQLVPQASNGKEDVYEYEPNNLGSCSEPYGCVSLISSGTAQQESAFLDASENGDDTFLITAQPLVPADHDSDYDVYDARVCSEASPCLKNEESSAQPCETSASCNPTTTTMPTFALPATLTAQTSGNPGTNRTLGYSSSKPASKPKPLTLKQKLALALKTCRKKTNRHKRGLCEREARKRYGPKPKAKRSRATTHKEKHQ